MLFHINIAIVGKYKKCLPLKNYTLKFETYSGILFVIVATPLIGKLLVGADVFTYPIAYVTEVILSLAIGHPISHWLYKNWYEKKIQNIEDLLYELKMFENEEKH